MRSIIWRSLFLFSLLLCLFAGARAALDERLRVLPGAEYGTGRRRSTRCT